MLVIHLNSPKTVFSEFLQEAGAPAAGKAGKAGKKGGPPPRCRVLLRSRGGKASTKPVVTALMTILRKSPEEAKTIALRVRFEGAADCGSYPHEIAETIVGKVAGFAKSQGHPLSCAMEPVEG